MNQVVKDQFQAEGGASIENFDYYKFEIRREDGDVEDEWHWIGSFETPVEDGVLGNLRLSGLPAGAIDITYTGIRPGEKLVEELHFDAERTQPTEHPKIHLAEQPIGDFDEVAHCVARLESAVCGSEAEARAGLAEAVPQYQAPSQDRAGQAACAVSRQ